MRCELLAACYGTYSSSSVNVGVTCDERECVECESQFVIATSNKRASECHGQHAVVASLCSDRSMMVAIEFPLVIVTSCRSHAPCCFQLRFTLNLHFSSRLNTDGHLHSLSNSANDSTLYSSFLPEQPLPYTYRLYTTTQHMTS